LSRIGRRSVLAGGHAGGTGGGVRPTKMNYEIHGNTLPHLHLHPYPRASDDPFVGGPIDPNRSRVRRTPEDLEVLKKSVEALPNDDDPVA
jgi:diadenosine tetraphosphate (Ap4A) HIT family hydrolase